jgi:hypothetical protein
MLINAQLETDADFRRQVYDYEFSGGVMFHTRGFGANFRYLKYTDGYTKIGAELDFVSIRHPKEIKLPGQQTLNYSNNRSFVYGKLNAFSSLRLGLGTEKILIDKTDQGSISINWLLFGGASFGFLRPIYLEINRKSPSGNDIKSVERYNPETHDFLNILGQAPLFTGMSGTKLRMGLYAKTGFAFDYNWNDESVSTIEIGAVVDYFPQWFGLYPEGGVPIMHEADNYEVWVQFYCTFNFGKKWN